MKFILFDNSIVNIDSIRLILINEKDISIDLFFTEQDPGNKKQQCICESFELRSILELRFNELVNILIK